MSRILRKLFRYLFFGLAALLLVAAGIFIYLTTDAGERRIADYVKSSADESMAGSLELSNLEFHGDSVELHGVKILSPAGETVLAAEQVNIDIALSSVLGDQIVLEELIVREFTVWVRQQNGQTSLQAALAPTEPSDDEGSVRIDRLELLDGTIVAQLGNQAGDQEASTFQIDDLDVSGSLTTGENLRFDLAGTGQVQDMTPGKLAIAVALDQGEARRQELLFDASLDDNAIHGQVALPDLAGEELNLRDIEGSLTANISSFEHQGFVYGPVDIAAELADERLHVEEALLELPGLHMHREPAEDDTVVLVVQLRSLEQTIRALSAFPGPRLPALAGSGTMTLRVSNPITSPQLAFQGQMSDLRMGEPEAQPVTVQSLKVEGRIEDLTRRRTGHVRADLKELRSGERSVASAHLEATLDDRELTLDAQVGAPYRAELHAEAERITADEARIDVLTLSYPRAKWRATEPAYLQFGGETGSLEELVLVNGEQRVELDASWDPAKRIDAKFSKFQLATIPRAVLEDVPKLGGTLNGQVQLEMQGDVMSGQVHATVANWEVAPASGERATLDARFADERIAGTLSMQAYGGKVHATFDAPMSPEEQPGRAKIDAEVRIESLQLAAMWRDFSGQIEPSSASKIQSLSGQLGGLVRVSGTAEEPIPSGRLSVSNGAITLENGAHYQDIRLRVQGTEKRLELRELIVHAGDGQVSLSGTATRIRPGRYRYDLRFDADAFPLPGEQPMVATAKGAVKGRASADQVEAELTFRDVVVEGQPTEKADRQIAIAKGESPTGRRAVRTRSGQRLRSP